MDLPAPQGTLPVFRGSSWEEHVETWRALEEVTEDAKWKQAAVAASLTARWGEKGQVIARFAHEVGCSSRRVYDYAVTWKAWASRFGKRSQILSFHHHTIAARDPDPEEAIEIAEVEGLSTRELAGVVKERRTRRGSESGAEVVGTMVCPRCGGSGEVPLEK